MKSSVLLKWGLFLSIALFCLGIRSGDISALQEKPAVSKLPPVEKKQPAEASNEKLPEIFLESTEHDGGAVYEGSVITHSFIVKNKGEGDLLIKKVKPG